MSMQHLFTVRDTHSKPISAFGRNIHRREILIGFEDGTIKTYDCENGFLIQTTKEHQGFITDFAYWAEPKFMFSASNDGTMVALASGGGLYWKYKFPYAVHSLCLNASKNQIIIGFKARIHVYQLDEAKISGDIIKFDSKFELYDTERFHYDIVKKMILHESRLFTAGYDQRILIFEVSAVSYGSRKVLQPVKCIKKAHETAIVCMVINNFSTDNPWLATGGFDKTVKIWSLDGDPTFRIDSFPLGLSSFCYIPHTKTLWVACGLSTPQVFDPKSADNISDYVEIEYRDDYPKQKLIKLDFFPQLSIAVASNSRRHLIVWKFNRHGCVGVLDNGTSALSLCYTRKEPLLVFCGGFDGSIKKWERAQVNMFAYTNDIFSYKEAQQKFTEIKGRRKIHQVLEENDDYDELKARAKSALAEKRRPQSAYAGFNVPLERSVKIHKHHHVGHLCQVFVEEIDLLISSNEDSNIYLWGFDAKAVRALQKLQRTSGTDSVTNRVAGFSCRNVLFGHYSVVTSVVVITGFQHIYMLSGGWDRRILIWNLDSEKFVDACQMGPVIESKDPKEVRAAREIACDGAILDMVYSPERNEFAYGCSDRLVYIRKFSPSGRELNLVNTLVGHTSEVTKVGWIPDLDCWISASEDATFRVWSGDGMECVQALSVPGPVSALCVDQKNSVVVVATGNLMQVYDIHSWKIQQKHHVFGEAVINSVIHIPERCQYVSGSADGTIALWNESKPANRAAKMRTKDMQDVADFLQNGPGYALSRDVSRASLISLTSSRSRYRTASSVTGDDPDTTLE